MPLTRPLAPTPAPITLAPLTLAPLTLMLWALALWALLAPVGPRAQPAGPPAEPLVFDRGPVTVHGTLHNDDARRFVLDLTAGQVLRIALASRNTSANFNVWAPGSDTAMVIGTITGPDFEGPVPVTGRYTIDLYLVRSAARRNEMAPFTLTVAVDGR